MQLRVITAKADLRKRHEIQSALALWSVAKRQHELNDKQYEGHFAYLKHQKCHVYPNEHQIHPMRLLVNQSPASSTLGTATYGLLTAEQVDVGGVRNQIDND